MRLTEVKESKSHAILSIFTYQTIIAFQGQQTYVRVWGRTGSRTQYLCDQLQKRLGSKCGEAYIFVLFHSLLHLFVMFSQFLVCLRSRFIGSSLGSIVFTV